jgi:hypothetical protein
MYEVDQQQFYRMYESHHDSSQYVPAASISPAAKFWKHASIKLHTKSIKRTMQEHIIIIYYCRHNIKEIA